MATRKNRGPRPLLQEDDIGLAGTAQTSTTTAYREEERIQILPYAPPPVAFNDNVPRIRGPPAGPSVGSRVWGVMSDAACCILSPIKAMLWTFLTVVVVLLVVAIALLIVLNKMDVVSSQTVTSLMSSASDGLVNVINGATDSDLALVAYRHSFNTMTASMFQPELAATMQGWVDSRPSRFSFSLTFTNVDETTIGALVLVSYSVADQTWVSWPLVPNGPPTRPLPNRTWAMPLLCTTQWTHCQQVHTSILSGDRLFLLVLAAGTAADQYPIPDPAILFKVKIGGGGL